MHIPARAYGWTIGQSYDLSCEFHPEEQFMSDDQLREALCGFTFVSEDSAKMERMAYY